MTDFGRDTLCMPSRRTGRMVSGKRLLAQRIVNRLRTRKGELRSDKNFGFYLPGLIGATVDDTMRGTLPIRIKNEVEKDEQVYSSEVSVTESVLAGRVTWTITIDVQSAEGPFRLVLTVDEVTVSALFEEAP